MNDKVALILLMIGMSPFIFWGSKLIIFLLLSKFIGNTLKIDVTQENGRVITKKILVTNKTSLKELLAFTAQGNDNRGVNG